MLVRGLTNKKRQAYFFGLWAEYYVIIILFFAGYIFLKRRFKTKFGEIDLLFKKGSYVIAVEVKARTDKSAQVEEVVGRRQLHRITNSLKIFLNKYEQYSNLDVRIDIVLVYKNLMIKHIKNVWNE